MIDVKVNRLVELLERAAHNLIYDLALASLYVVVRVFIISDKNNRIFIVHAIEEIGAWRVFSELIKLLHGEFSLSLSLFHLEGIFLIKIVG